MKNTIAMFGVLTSLALGATPSVASATEFLFTYSGDLGANGASGTLFASANSDGTFTATSGTITEFGPVATGTGTLIANPSAPMEILSASGFFLYDDQLLPGQNPSITHGGLLFDIDGAEINIFSNGPGPDTYSIYSNDGVSANGDFALSEVAAVPEPATWAMMLVGLGLIGYAARRRRRVSVSYS